MNHIICATCGILLECDWMSIGLDYDDICENTDDDYHCQIEKPCNCELKTTLSNKGVAS